ncbi:hypothetical protein KJ903_05830 [Patescibacteria group bacterium]|nr:hypothetical protein [Patescibacteria group bacterium]
MRTLVKVLGVPVVVLSMLAITGVASAASTETLQPASPTGGPASTIAYSEPVTISETLTVAKPGYFRQGVHIGSTEADVGGVTYFNGTIVNAALDSSGNSTIPVTFGDDVRIDGEIYRTEIGGDNPLKLADTMTPAANNTYDLGTSSYQFKDAYFAGTVNVGALGGSGIVSSANITDGAVATADIASGAITQTAESSGNVTATQSTIKTGTSYDVADTVTITTETSTLFCMYSNLVSSDAVSQTTNMAMYVDGQVIPHTYRRETTDAGEGQGSLAASALINVTAGSHTIEVRWNTSGGTATMYSHALDVIELKK